MAGAMDERRAAILVLRDPRRAGDVDLLAAELRASRACEVEIAGDADRLLRLEGTDAVYADWSDRPLTEEQGRRLAGFVHAGGTLVAAGGTLSAWAANPRVVDLAGWSPDGRTMHTELVVEPTDRSAGIGSFPVHDTVHLLPSLPDGATPLLRTHWRFGEQVVAYARPAGAGRFVYFGLGSDPQTYASVEFRRAVLGTLVKSLRAESPTRVVGVGLLGFGALGSAHVAAIRGVPGFEVRAVCDLAEARREAAFGLGIPAYPATREFFAADVDVVIVGTPPADHANSVLAALDSGKHVVSEKPLAITTADCDRMIERATATQRVLTVYQNRRWDPDFLALANLVHRGGIGDLFYMESFVGEHAHPCHFWHSHQPVSGGSVYDWGSHYVDWMLQLFDPPVIAVRAVEHKLVWHDVTNADHVNVELRFESGAQAFFTQSSIAAARKPKWYLLGTRGAVVGNWQHAVERHRGPDGEMDETLITPTDLPARLIVSRPGAGGGSDDESLSLPTRDRSAFYRNLAGHLRFGEPLAVTAAQARRTVAVLEAAAASSERGGAVVATHI
jgi:scyllo-inositol 2-dehydrogenase (NADP+)